MINFEASDDDDDDDDEVGVDDEEVDDEEVQEVDDEEEDEEDEEDGEDEEDEAGRAGRARRTPDVHELDSDDDDGGGRGDGRRARRLRRVVDDGRKPESEWTIDDLLLEGDGARGDASVATVHRLLDELHARWQAPSLHPDELAEWVADHFDVTADGFDYAQMDRAKDRELWRIGRLWALMKTAKVEGGEADDKMASVCQTFWAMERYVLSQVALLKSMGGYGPRAILPPDLMKAYLEGSDTWLKPDASKNNAFQNAFLALCEFLSTESYCRAGDAFYRRAETASGLRRRPTARRSRSPTTSRRRRATSAT